MQNILRIDSSIFGANGSSSQLLDTLVKKLRALHPDSQVIQRDLALQPIPHFDAVTMQAVGEGRAELADQLIAEVQQADVVLIAAPMYNFGIPSQLKAWFDHIARAQLTFKYTENGPVGLLRGKRVYVVTTRGGQYKDSPQDTLVPYLKIMLNFLGLAENLQFIYAEGLAMVDTKESALQDAKLSIQQLLPVAGEVA